MLALLDDAAAGAALLELSSPLARVLQRELSVVYVESSRSLVAAALPFTQVLPRSGAAVACRCSRTMSSRASARTRRACAQLTARIALRDALRWSLRVVRGSLGEAAIQLQSESDLLLLAGTPPLPTRSGSDAASRPTRRQPLVAVLGDGDEASQRTWQVASELARALMGVVEVVHIDRRARRSISPNGCWALARCDVLVLPRTTLDAGALARVTALPGAAGRLKRAAEGRTRGAHSARTRQVLCPVLREAAARRARRASQSELVEARVHQVGAVVVAAHPADR